MKKLKPYNHLKYPKVHYQKRKFKIEQGNSITGQHNISKEKKGGKTL